MAITDADAEAVAKQLARLMFTEANATATLSVPQLKDAVVALHDYLESNAVGINQSLPVALRSAMTTPQKSFAMALAAMKYGGLI